MMRLEPMPPHKASLFPALRSRIKAERRETIKGLLYTFALGVMIGIIFLLVVALFGK